MEEASLSKTHRIVLNNRKNCSVSGVTDVISFDLNQVLLETSQGMLTIKGKDLHVGKLSVEKGEMELDGSIDSITYSDIDSLAKKGESILTRLFK